jgi:hypothetical protein
MRTRSLTIVLLSLLIVCASLMAQTAATGALQGTVSDPTGAVIPNATVTLTNTETGQERTGTTGADGVYRFPLLPPGTYRIKFAANGFKGSEATGVKVNVTETPVLDRKLEVGAAAEQVTVEANVETIQTASSSLGTTVGGATATALPLTTRNYTNLLGLSAGANASVSNATSLGKGNMEIAVNGARTDQNTFQMDGVSIVNYASSGVITQGATYATFGVPNPDTIAEFKIQTSLYDAGYGRNPGANVNVVTKSGTNELHGTGFEFFRNTALNANDFFRNRQGGSKLVLNQNQFGGTLGGPIKKDKLFVFGSYQQTWQKNGIASQGLSTISLPYMPGGDRGVTSLTGVDNAAASAFRQALGAAYAGKAMSAGGQTILADGSNINPIAMRFLQAKADSGAYVMPGSCDVTTAACAAHGVASGVQFSNPAYSKEYQGMLNLDYVVSAKNTLSSRYFRSNEDQIINFLGAGYAPGVPATNPFGYQEGVLKLTTIVTNSLVNELRGSVQRTLTDAYQNPPASTYASAIYGLPTGTNFLGVIDSHGNPVPGGSALPFSPVVNLTGAGLYQAMGSSANDESVHNLQFQVADQISWTKGKHTLRAGFEFERVNWAWDYLGLSRGIMAFNTFQDFLMGLPGNCGAYQPGVCNGGTLSNMANSTNFAVRSGPGGIVHAYRARNANWFVQDDWKVNQKLTVNLGVRWEYDGLPGDKYGNAVNLWVSQLGTVNNAATFPNSPLTATAAGWVVPSNYDTKTWGPLPAGVINSGKGYATLSDVPKNNFAPRLGFAWQPIGSKLVIRGGAGFFYDRVPGNTIIHAIEQSPPYSITLDQSGPTNSFASLAQPFQQIPLGTFPTRWTNFAAVQANPNLSPGLYSSNLTQSSLYDTFLTPLVYSWNLNAQYELPARMVLEIGYVGSRGIHQSETLHIINEPGLATAANPINGITINTPNNAAARVPYLGFGPVGLQYAQTGADYKFNSFQSTLRKQLSHGISFQAAYTFSRAFTTLYAAPAGVGGVPGGQNSGDPLNTRQQYGLNGQYRPQRFVVNYSWDIPSGNLKGVLGVLTKGWNLSGVTTIQGGQPLTVYDNRGGSIFGMNGTSIVTSRAQMAPGMTYANVASTGGIEQRLGGASGGPGYFNASAFVPLTCTLNSGVPTANSVCAVAPDGTVTSGTPWGNSGIGILLGPGQFNFDASVAKMTRVGGIHENAQLQFRAEFFNIFNHAQFNAPASVGLQAGTFGQITSTSVNPRLIQFALKYIF